MLFRSIRTRILAGVVALSLALSGNLYFSAFLASRLRADETDVPEFSETENETENTDEPILPGEPEADISSALQETSSEEGDMEEETSLPAEEPSDNETEDSDPADEPTIPGEEPSSVGTEISQEAEKTAEPEAPVDETLPPSEDPSGMTTEPNAVAADPDSTTAEPDGTTTNAGDVTTNDNDVTTNDNDVAEEPSENQPSSTIEEPSETTEADLGKSRNTVPASSFEAVTASGITVQAVVPDGAFAKEVTMLAEDVVPDADMLNMASDVLDENKCITGVCAVDIKFVDDQGNVLEPQEGYGVQVSITLPPEKKMDGDSFSVLHVTEEGAATVEDATVDENGGDFTAESFSIYILTAVGEMNSHTVHDWIVDLNWMTQETIDGKEYVENSVAFPYVVQQNDSVTLVAYSEGQYDGIDLQPLNQANAQNQSLHLSVENSQHTWDAEKNMWRHEFTYHADSPGIAKAVFGDGTGQNCFYMAVAPTPLPEGADVREFNMVWDWSLAEYNTPDNPYCVTEGDVLRILSSSMDFWFTDRSYGTDNPPWGATGNMHLYRFGDSTGSGDAWYNDLHTSMGDWQKDNYIAGCNVRINGETRTIYFKILPGKILDHADIEIADGGRYTASTVYIENGKLYKKIDIYSTYVEQVNDCVLYKSSDDSETVRFFDGSGNTLIGRTGYVQSDYHFDPRKTADHSQYELTSKYEIYYDEQGNRLTRNFSDIKYNYNDVDHAVFDVQMLLVPELEIICEYYVDPVTGEERWIQQGDPIDISDREQKHLDSNVFHLTHQHVIDAYNKCPNQSGLDFTLHANAAMIQISASKQLLHGTLEEGDFEFILSDSEGNIVGQASNAADGTVIFDEMWFDEARTYVYTLEEIPDNTRNNIHFDETVYTVTVEVKKRADGLLEAEIALPHKSLEDINYKFVNEVMFTLPDTGGGGTGPYFGVGAALILSAAILLFLRKAKVIDL